MSLFGKKDVTDGKDAADSGGREGRTRGKAGKPGYGIAETTLLMRSLPVDQNVELVVRVVRSTLESMNVQLPDIIEDAEEKEKGLHERMSALNAEIAEFSALIDQRRQEITRLQEELTETTTVRERLLLAQKPPAGTAVPPPFRGVNGAKTVTELRELTT
jgi:hypothetical protein